MSAYGVFDFLDEFEADMDAGENLDHDECRDMIAALRNLRERIDGLSCMDPDKCPGPGFSLSSAVCSVCVFRDEVLS